MYSCMASPWRSQLHRNEHHSSVFLSRASEQDSPEEIFNLVAVFGVASHAGDLGELVYILGRDEIRAPLKTPAQEAIFGEKVPYLRISATDSKLRNISCTQLIKKTVPQQSPAKRHSLAGLKCNPAFHFKQFR